MPMKVENTVQMMDLRLKNRTGHPPVAG